MARVTYVNRFEFDAGGVRASDFPVAGLSIEQASLLHEFLHRAMDVMRVERKLAVAAGFDKPAEVRVYLSDGEAIVETVAVRHTLMVAVPDEPEAEAVDRAEFEAGERLFTEGEALDFGGFGVGDRVRVREGFGAPLLEAVPGVFAVDGTPPEALVEAPDGRLFRVAECDDDFYGCFGTIIGVDEQADGEMYELDATEGWYFYGWQLEAM